MPLDPGAFRDAMSRLATAVTVVSLRDETGAALGMTASAVCSLSLEPPMILACIDRSALMHDRLMRAPAFGISVLAEGQAAVAERFADRLRQPMGDADAASPAGLPLVAGALAHLECRRAEVFVAGDHAIVTGVVEWAALHEGAPLTYFRSRYGGLAR